MGSINILTPILMTFVELLPENSLIMLNNRVKFFAHFELYHIFILHCTMGNGMTTSNKIIISFIHTLKI